MTGVLVAVVLLAGNAFFVGAQFALITARRDQVEPLAGDSRAARVTLDQMTNLSRMLAGSQLGIAVCSLGLGAVAEPTFAHLLEGLFDLVHLPEALLHPISFMIALAFVSYCHMVLGEMVPKNLALAGPVRAALMLGPVMAVWVRATRPVLVVTNGIADLTLRLFRVEPKDELNAVYTADELVDLIEESAAEGYLDAEERQRLRRALGLERSTARDLALPLDGLVSLAPLSTPHDLEELVARTGYSRFPVRSGGQLLGYLHAKDILDVDPASYDRPIAADRRRQMVSIPAAARLTEVFAAMQAAGVHLGRVVDGPAVLGAIALEDVLEQIVGEVQDGFSSPGRGGAGAAGR